MKNVLPMIPGELISDYRIRLALEQVHADERRRAELSELTATANAPDAQNPRLGAHTRPQPAARRGSPVLNSVAAATRLTLEQVHAEQRRRLMPRRRASASTDAGLTLQRRGGFGSVTRSHVPGYCAPSHTLTAKAATDWRSACGSTCAIVSLAVW